MEVVVGEVRVGGGASDRGTLVGGRSMAVVGQWTEV